MSYAEIQNGPAPVPVRPYGINGKYPWLTMAVGDWFYFPPALKSHSAHSVARGASIRHARKYVAIKTAEGYIAKRVA